MKTSWLVACAFVLGCGALSASAEDDSAGHCSLDSLHGTMGWSTTTSTSTGVSSTGSGQESYDGKGHMKYFEFYNNGYSTTTFTGTATYTITDNCIATVTYDSEVVPWVYFVSADGEHYFWSNNQGNGFLSSGRADRVSHALLVK